MKIRVQQDFVGSPLNHYRSRHSQPNSLITIRLQFSFGPRCRAGCLETQKGTILASTLYQATAVQQLRFSKMFDQSLSCNDKMCFELVKDTCLMEAISMSKLRLILQLMNFYRPCITDSIIDMFLHHLGLLEAKER